MAEVATAPESGSLVSGVAAVSSRYRRYILALLVIAYTLSFLDRQVLGILVEPIERDLHVGDAQIGILTGPIFVIFYTFLGMPIAWLADRLSRPLIIAVSLTLWSAFTAVSGLAASFRTLALARLGVGFGEAGCNPSSHSLIADISTPSQRASGLAIYSLGVPIGTMLGSALGGVLADAFGWRVAFMVAGAPGLVLAATLALTVREPRRRARAATVKLLDAIAKALADYGQVLRELAGKRTFWLVAAGSGFSAFVGYAHLYFVQAFFMRTHLAELTALAAPLGLKAQGFLGIATGLVIGVGGLVGSLAGGYLADWAVGRDRRAFMSVPAVAALIVIPLYFVIFTLPATLPAIALFLVPNVAATIWYGPVYATAQSVVPPHSRATAAALLLLILNLIGLLLGPTFLGATSQFLATTLGRAEGLRWAMIITGCFSVVAAALFWLARGRIREDVVS
jgi:predicted MFS family arabinose efflux permease